VTQDGRFGLLVPRGDRAALSRAMVEMLDPEVRARYARLGPERVEALSPEASANALIDFLVGRLAVVG
jgi:glycosyltransferase involved in cell wall biosynthesis